MKTLREKIEKILGDTDIGSSDDGDTPGYRSDEDIDCVTESIIEAIRERDEVCYDENSVLKFSRNLKESLK